MIQKFPQKYITGVTGRQDNDCTYQIMGMQNITNNSNYILMAVIVAILAQLGI